MSSPIISITGRHGEHGVPGADGSGFVSVPLSAPPTITYNVNSASTSSNTGAFGLYASRRRASEGGVVAHALQHKSSALVAGVGRRATSDSAAMTFGGHNTGRSFNATSVTYKSGQGAPDGAAGSDGGAGGAGESISSITLQISAPAGTVPRDVVLPQPINTFVDCKCEVISLQGEQRRFESRVNVAPESMLQLKVCGGNGGRGGSGGRGHDGGIGADGVDATMLMHGLDGCDGGNGGRGGAAGPGGDGGSAGQAHYLFSVNDTYLLMLCAEPSTAGGSGGKHGAPGDGGNGGQGGQGGMPYTWQELVMDAEGNQVQETRKKPAGRNGRWGQVGARGATASSGADGDKGHAMPSVLDGKSTVTYISRYDLSLQGADLSSEKEDGIFEPGSMVFVTSVTVKNIGEMPTPASYSVLVYIKPTPVGEDWVVSEGYGRFTRLPLHIQGGEVSRTTTRDPDEQLAFRIAPLDRNSALYRREQPRERGNPFRATTSLLLRAQMTPLGRDFHNFVRPLELEIRYPVEMSEIIYLPSVPPGGQTLVRFSLTNVSLKDYGRHGQLGREVMVKITHSGGDADASRFTFVPISQDGGQLDPVTFATTATSTHGRVILTIPLLSPKSTMVVEGLLKLAPDCVPYTTATFSVELLLGKINEPRYVVPIQQREMTVCVAKGYEKTPGARVLLVTNSQTTRTEVQAWEELAGRIFGPASAELVNIWDVSMMGHLDLRCPLSNQRTLSDDWENDTLVILNNPFDNFVTRTAREPYDHALNYLCHNGFASIVASRGVHVCVVSPVHGHHLGEAPTRFPYARSNAIGILSALLDPFTITSPQCIVYKHPRDFIAEEVDVHADGTKMKPKLLRNWFAKPRPPIHRISTSKSPDPPPYTEIEHVVLLRSEGTQNLAEDLHKMLMRKRPGRRYVLSTCNTADIQQWANQVGYVLPQSTRAAIRIRRVLDVSSLVPRVTLVGAPESSVGSPEYVTMHSHAFVRSPQVTAGFVQSIPFSRRVDLYAEALTALNTRLVSGDEESRASVLRQSILADLACEQAALRLKMRTHRLTKASIMLLLPRLGTFCRMALAHMDVTSRGGKHLLDLLAEFSAYMDVHRPWYEPLLYHRRSKKVTKVTKALLDDFVPCMFTDPPPIKAGARQVLQMWKRDVWAVPHLLKARALAGVLGPVIDRSNEWYGYAAIPDTSSSTLGSVWTEFTHGFRPNADGHALRTITEHSEATKMTRLGTLIKGKISSMETANKRAILHLGTSSATNGDPGHELPPRRYLTGRFGSSFYTRP